MPRKGKNPRPPKKFEHNGQSNTDKTSSEGGRIAPSRTAWNRGGKTAETLFPDAELVATPMRDNDEEINKAIRASLESYEAQNRSGVPFGERYTEDPEENLANDDYWSNNAHRNLPSPEREKVKKAPDTNNNSAMKKSIGSTLVERTFGSSATPRTSSVVRETVDKFERAIESFDEPSTPEKPLVVDRYGRIGGQNESHMYMGSGGRKKEAAYIEEQKKKGLLVVNDDIAKSDKVKNEHEVNRTKHNKSSQNTTNGDDEPRKSLKSLKPETRSRRESIERASDDDRKPANHERISSERNMRMLEASSSVKNKPRVRSNDRQAEKSRTDEIPATEPSKTSIRQSQDDFTGKPESKALHIADFNSRHNKPKVIEDDNSTSTSRPELIKSPASIRRDALKSNDDEGACSQARIKTADSSLRAHDPPPGFRASSQHEISNASDTVLQSEALYDRLAVHDPSLYRLLVQKKMSELALSDQTAVHSLQGAQDNFIDYDDYPAMMDNRGNDTIDAFFTPEQQAANYQQSAMNYGQMANSSQHILPAEFPHGIHHGAIGHNFRPDDSAINYPARQYPEGYTIACMNGTDPYGNIVQVPIIFPPSSGSISPGPSNFPPTPSAYGFSQNYERFSLLKNQGPPNVHQRPMIAMNPAAISQQRFCFSQQNFHPAADNHRRTFERRSAFNSGHGGNINYLPGNRQPGTLAQTMQFPRENRGRARTQQNH